MTSAFSPLSLDETVFPLRERVRSAGLPDPEALFLMATGTGFLPSRAREVEELELGELCGELGPWSGAVLRAGRLGSLSAWFLDDAVGEPSLDEPAPPWMAALPVWLAAASGAALCVHTSAGSALPADELGRVPLAPRSFALVSDHVNFSGSSPLVGLGESRLGPLFPDLSQLHHAGLRAAAEARARTLGLVAREAVAACTLGPALETPAERRMLARLGADVAVPGLATPLVAAGHAGLALLAIVAVTDAPEQGVELRSVLEAASQMAPSLEDLLLALAPDLAATAARLAAEAGP